MQQRDVLPNLLRTRAEEQPDRLYINDVNGESRTYGELYDSVRRWATVLTDRGVEPGDRVLVMQPTSITAYELWAAAAVLHAIEVPVNTQYMGNILAYLVNNSSAEVAVCAQRFLPTILDQREHYRELRTVIVSDAKTVEPVDGIEIVAGAPLHRDAAAVAAIEPVQPWEIGTILYTSGTTGPSKGVLVPWAQSHATAVGSAPERALRSPNTVYYGPYPSFHVSGKAPFYGTLLGGGRIVVRERFDTPSFWPDIRANECNFTMLMGATANFMYRQPPSDEDTNNPLRGILFSPWTNEVEEFKTRFGVEAYSVFNMTEISSPIVAGWDNETIADPRSCGKARPGYELRIVDDHDQAVPTGSPGELIIRSTESWTLMAGYWQMPEKTVEAWRNQWLHTGDLFSVDEQGNYFYLDRKKDSIRRRGENISSMEIEAEVVSHPAVLESAAVSIPDTISEEEVKIVVVLKPGRTLEPAELIGYLAERMPRFMVPRYVEFLDALPKTPTEKIRKTELRDAGVTPDTWDREAAGVMLAP